MSYYDEQLRLLLEQTKRKQRLETVVSELHVQEEELQGRREALAELAAREQADADRLEKAGLAAFFCSLAGRKEEKLNKERTEAMAARVKLETAERELEAVREELRCREEELAGLADCEAQYDRTLREKAGALKAAGGKTAEAILKMEGRLLGISHECRELEEAISAGDQALSTADSVLDRLSRAENWAVWDMVGGGLFADLAKHDELDTAQQELELMQRQLRTFRTELADVHLPLAEQTQIRVDGFLRFFDCFVDGLLFDYQVMGRIQQSIRQVEETWSQIQAALGQLYSVQEEKTQELDRVRRELDKLVFKAGQS